MKRRTLFLPLTLIFSIIIFSCEKDDNYPKKYSLDAFSVGQLRVYTNTGEITELNTINNFVAGQEDYFWPAGYSDEIWGIEIELISESSAKLSNSETTVYFDLVRNNGLLYFQEKGTTPVYLVPTDERLKYPPLSPNSWYFAIESGNEIYFPFVSYHEIVFSNTGEIMSVSGIGNYNNEFNTSYLEKLQNQSPFIDTIAFQENRIVFGEK